MITKESMYVMFTMLDLISKSVFTYNYQLLNVKMLRNKYGLLKVVRMFFPKMCDALTCDVINESDFKELMQHLDLSKDDMMYFKNLLVDELFPDEAWKEMLSPCKTYKLFPKIGILFCDIVGYSEYVINNPIDRVITFVDAFYTSIDLLVNKMRVQKVETIGDAYLIVSEDIVSLMECAQLIVMEFHDRVRIGIHIGEAASCTLGFTKLRHAYVGHPVNMASRLESSGVPGKIHISNQLKEELIKLEWKGTFVERGEMELKGIGSHTTFFAHATNGSKVDPSPFNFTSLGHSNMNMNIHPTMNTKIV
jgi:class 3 adenylate cyclase